MDTISPFILEGGLIRPKDIEEITSLHNGAYGRVNIAKKTLRDMFYLKRFHI